jgi:hypothetical protein
MITKRFLFAFADRPVPEIPHLMKEGKFLTSSMRDLVVFVHFAGHRKTSTDPV